MKLVVLLGLSLVPTSPALPQARPAPDFTARFRQVIEAVQRRDTMFLHLAYADHYTFTLGGGDSVTTLSKGDRLRAIAADPDTVTTLSLERCDFDLFGPTSVGHCWIRQRNVNASQSEWVGIYTTVIFSRSTAGRWQIVASHSSVNRPKRRNASP